MKVVGEALCTPDNWVPLNEGTVFFPKNSLYMVARSTELISIILSLSNGISSRIFSLVRQNIFNRG